MRSELSIYLRLCGPAPFGSLDASSPAARTRYQSGASGSESERSAHRALQLKRLRHGASVWLRESQPYEPAVLITLLLVTSLVTSMRQISRTFGTGACYDHIESSECFSKKLLLCSGNAVSHLTFLAHLARPAASFSRSTIL